MSTPEPTTARIEVEPAGVITPIRHRLGGPVDVIGYDATGERVGVIVNPIDEDEVDVIDNTGLAVKLVVTPAVEDPE